MTRRTLCCWECKISCPFGVDRLLSVSAPHSPWAMALFFFLCLFVFLVRNARERSTYNIVITRTFLSGGGVRSELEHRTITATLPLLIHSSCSPDRHIDERQGATNSRAAHPAQQGTRNCRNNSYHYGLIISSMGIKAYDDND